MNKKGIFFTFIAITLMVVFVLVFTPQADVSLRKDTQSVRIRLNTLNSYVDDFENGYLETILRATTHKTILSLVFYMNSTGAYLPNLNAAFSEVSINGTINKVPIDTITGKKIMDNNTLTNWTNKIIKAAQDTLNANTTIKINSVSVYQTNPWNIDAKLDVNFTVVSNAAVWKKKSTVITTISIEGIHDPYYLVNTNKRYTNQIKKSSVNFNEWNLSRVREHLRNGTYVHWQSSGAPSFLMRFTNTISNSSCCGIESLVNPNKITPSDRTERYVDYLFWNQSFAGKCKELYNITDLWDEFKYFKLDLDHVAKYNLTGQNTTKAC